MDLQGGNHTDYDSNIYLWNRFKYIINDLKEATGSLLVIGAGDGSFEKRLKESNSEILITSLDLNGAFRNRLAELSDNVIIGDFLKQTFTQKYNYIVCTDVIEHIFDTDEFFIKANNILYDEGIFYLQTPNLASWHGRLTLMLGYTPEAMEVSNIKAYFGRPGIFRHEKTLHHVRVFTYRAIREMSEFYKFKILNAIGIDPRIPILFKHFPGISGSVCLKLTKNTEKPERE